jgi:hypothetical protein
VKNDICLTRKLSRKAVLLGHYSINRKSFDRATKTSRRHNRSFRDMPFGPGWKEKQTRPLLRAPNRHEQAHDAGMMVEILTNGSRPSQRLSPPCPETGRRQRGCGNDNPYN